MAVATAGWLTAVHRETDDVLADDADHVLALSQLDVLAAARAPAIPERERDGARSGDAGERVGVGDAGLLRRAAA